MKKLRFVWIGKLKKRFWQDAAGHYWQLLKKFYRLEEICLKDGPAKLSTTERMHCEGQAILKNTGTKDLLIVLDEKGKNLSSYTLAKNLQKWIQEPFAAPCFVIGGAFGLSPQVKAQSYFTFSLGALTLPHELARIVVLEQLYRATSINSGLPYHHGQNESK